VRGNPHAAFDVAGAGNVAWSRWCDTRRRKGEPTGNTNIDLNRRVSPRPYCHSREHNAVRHSPALCPNPFPICFDVLLRRNQFSVGAFAASSLG
jgi:hypothetical protein